MKLSPALRFISNQHWAMTPSIFDAMMGIIERHANGEKAGGLDDLFSGDRAEEPRMQIIGPTAVIPMRGVFARYADQVNGICQNQGRSAEAIQKDIATAVANPAIKQIIMRVDSPGGTVAGTAETAERWRQASASGKKTIAYIDGLAASALLWITSQSDQVIASSPTAQTGSLGVITAHIDVSKIQEARGQKIHIFRSTSLKAPGAMGEALSSEQEESIHRELASLHDAFAIAVQAGRGLTDAQRDTVSTGEVWTATKSIELGLVDRIVAWDDLLVELHSGKIAPSFSHTPRARHSVNANSDDTSNKPAATAADTKGDPMKITAQVLAALITAHSTHATHIAARAEAGDDEATIRSSIVALDRTNLEAQVKDLKAANEALKTEHATKLKAEQDSHEKTKLELAAAKKDLEALGGIAPKHADPGDGTSGNKVTQVKRADWQKNQSAYTAGIDAGTIVVVD